MNKAIYRQQLVAKLKTYRPQQAQNSRRNEKTADTQDPCSSAEIENSKRKTASSQVDSMSPEATDRGAAVGEMKWMTKQDFL